MSRLSMKDGRIVIGEQDEKPKNTTQKTNTSNSRLSMVDGRIVLADKPAANAANNQQYLQKTRAAQQQYQAMDDVLPQRRTSNVMDLAINSLRNRVANSTIGRAANEWASRVSGNVQNVLNESPEYRAAKRQARADNEARRQQFAIDTANIIDQASAQYEGPTRTETVRGRFTDTEGADMFSNDWEPGEEKEIEYTRTVRNENYNPLSREDRDALISRYADAMNGKTDANGYQQVLYDVTKNGGIEQLYREQQADAANDREYGRQLRGVDLDSMNFWQRLGGTLGGTVAGAGEQIASSGVGLAVSGLNREAGIATQEFGPALEQTARRWFYALANGADDDPAVEEQIRTLASYVGVDADTLVSRVKDRAEQARNSEEDQAFFAYGLLDGLEADQDKIWENAQQAIADAGFYDTINNLQQKSAEHIQYAKDLNLIQNQFGDNLVEAGVSTIQNAADAAMAATLGLSGTGVIAMIPFALRAYGGTYAEQMQQATELGGVIGQDVAKKAAQSAGISSAIEVGTEMMWGMVGAMSKVTGGGALDDAAQQRLTEILSGWAKTETGKKILTTVGEKALGGITEGLEEVIGDAAEQILKNAGIMPGEAEEWSDWVKNAGHSFVTGALGGLLGEFTSVVSSPMQQSQIGKQLKAGGLDISLSELADLANSEGMENTSLAKAYSDVFSGMPRNIESISDIEAGKLYTAYEEMLGKRSEAIDRIEQLQAKLDAGEALTRADVNRITNNSDAVAILSENGTVSEDAFSGGINERRDAVEMALRAFANDSTALSETDAENVQAGTENANATVSAPNPFLTMSNSAIDNIVRNAQPMSPAQSIRESNTGNALAGNVLRSAARVVDAAERLNVSERGQDVMARMYSPNMDAIDYVGEMTKYYNQGKEGKTFDVGSIEGVSAIQAQAAFNAGRQEYIERSNNGEEGLRVRTSSERQNGQSAGGPVGVVEESTGAAQGRQAGSFQREGGNARVSSESLRQNASYAIANAGLRVVTNDSRLANAKKYAEDHGMNFVAWAGGALTIDGEQSRGYYDPETNTVYVRADHQLFTAEQLTIHETTHGRIRNGEIVLGRVDGKEETASLKTVYKTLVKELGGLEKFEEVLDAYVEIYAGINISRQGVFEEMICDAMAGMNDFLSVGHFEEALKHAAALETAGRVARENAANGEKAGQTESGGKKSIDRDYADTVKEWYTLGMPDNRWFSIGSTGDVLQGLGAIDNDIYINGDKIKLIFEEHPEMSIREIQRIPEILENPTLVLKSTGENLKRGEPNTRLVVFGTVKDRSGVPVLAALDLKAEETRFVVDGMQKVNSAYGKDRRPIEFLQKSDVLYAANKEKTAKLLRSLGLHLRPSELLQSGFIGNIAYYQRGVNISGESFANLFPGIDAAADFEKKQYQNKNVVGQIINELGDSGEYNSEAGGSHSRELDPDKLRELNSGKTMTVYRSMQLIKGKLYPPMAAKIDDGSGKRKLVEPTVFNEWYRADEHPELLDKNGKFKLDKTKGTPLNVAYNPYWHTSNMMLNDQFSGAYDRPNLVTVECEIPESELTSGYKAQYAKDAVGLTPWHSGPVATQLGNAGKPRNVYLSRWVKVKRIVPDSEVAKSIAKTLEGTGISVPVNTVTPSLRSELEKIGVPVSEAFGLDKKTSAKLNASLAKVEETFDANTESAAPTGEFSRDIDSASNFDTLYTTLEDGRIRPNNVEDLSTEDWQFIYKVVKKLGYGIESAKQAKEVYSRYVGQGGFNKEQSEAIKKAYGVSDSNGIVANPKREALARKTFGTTGDFREAGYLMRNGSMLDFSGKKDGGPAHVRYMDHREIGSVFGEDEIPEEKRRYGDASAYMNAFISEGNIRLMDGQGVTIGEMEPTSQQYTILKQFINRTLKNEDYFYLDLSNNDGNTIESRDYSSDDGADRIIRDIKAYYKNGELPYRSELSKFYSRDIDSTGKELSEGQKAYFADSKSRDDSGRLKVMYQGSPEDFTVFDRKKSKGSNLYGRGFYFTDNENAAKTYGKTKPYYLNVVNPLSPGQSVITRSQMRRFLEAVYDDQDEYSFENYGENATVGTVLKSLYGKGDFEMLQDVNATAIGDMVAAVELFNEVNGTEYDGLILPTETVVFSSAQAKNIDNENPTDNPDVRFSRDQTFSDQIDLCLAGKMARNSSVYVADTPELLQAVGLKDYPILMSQRHVKNIVAPFDEKKHQHGLSENQLKSIDQEIVDPVMIMESASMPGDVVVVTGMKNFMNQPVILSIHPDGNGKYNGLTVESNYGTSLYGKRSVGTFITEAANQNRILYNNAKRTRALAREARVQFSGALTNDGFFEQNIAQFQSHRQEDLLVSEKDFSKGRHSRDLTNYDLVNANRELQKDITELRSKLKTRTEQYKYWKGQTKVTEGRQLRTEDVTRLAREIIKGQESNADAKAVAEKMKALGEYILNTTDENVYDEARLKAYEIAHDILSNAKVLNEQGGEHFYKDFRDALKQTPIYVTPSVREEVSPDGWSGLRQMAKGIFTPTADKSKGKTVDVIYHDLQSTFGEWLLPEYITSEADQLNKIFEVVETYQPVYENINSYDMADATEWTANEILTRIIGNEIRETNPTYADRMEKKLSDQKVKSQEALRRVREQRDRKVQNLKEHYQQVAEDRRNRKIDSEMRTRLLNIAKRLNNKKLDRVTRGLLDQYIGELDLVSKGILGRTVKELETLQAWYDSYKESMGDDFIPDKFIERKIARLSKKHISDLTQEEVADLTTVLLNLETMIRTQNQLIESQIKMDAYAAGVQTIDDINNSNGRTGFLNKYISTETATPEREIHRITGYRDSSPLYKAAKELSDGQRKMLDYQMRAEALFKKWTTENKFIRRIAGKNAEEITVSGYVNGQLTDVKITPAMRMALYLHEKNDDNMRHISKGGVKIPDMALYKKGKLQEAYDKATRVVFTRGMLKEIASKMSADEKAFADAVDRYYNGMSRNEINDTSEALRGYAIAGVEHYYPIDTDGSFLKKEFDAIKRDGSIEGMGILKERIEGATNPIMLYDMNDTLNRSISQHSKYVGLAIPVRNFNKLYGVTTHNYETSVAETLKKNWGSAATNYIEKMMADVQNGTGLKSDAWGDLLAKARSHYAGAVLTTNASVAIKQAASYPTAAAVVGYGPLIKAFADVSKVDLDTLAKYTPLLWYRSKGFSTAELGDIGKEGRQIPKALNWIQGMDVATTTKLVKAAMIYVNENQQGLVRNTDAWWKAVAEVYNRIIEETQPNYTMMQRPQILRSDNALTRAVMMFKTQPFQNFNILYDAFGNLSAKSREYKANATQENLQALKSARINAVRAVSSQVVSAFVFALMQFAWDAFRGKIGKYKDDDEEMTFLSWMKGIGINMLSSVGGIVPFGSLVLELGEAMTDAVLKAFKLDPVFDQTFYGLTENSAESVNDVSSALLNLGTKIAQTLSGNEITESTVRSLVDSMGDIAQFAGIPVNNVIKLAQAIGRNIYLATEGRYVGGYNALRLTTDPARYSSDYYDLLWKAYNNDKAAYDEVLQMMLDDKSGTFTEKKIKDNFEKRMKKQQGVNHVDDLESRWMAPTQQKTYDEGLADLEKATMFQAATDDQQKEVMKQLYDIAIDNAAGKKISEVIEGGKSVGLDTTEYLLYQIALQMADTPNKSGNLGSYSQEETEAAILMIPGLTKEERIYLYDVQWPKAKTNPFK